MKKLWISLLCSLSILLFSFTAHAQLVKITSPLPQSVAIFYSGATITITNRGNTVLPLNNSLLRFQSHADVNNVIAANKNIRTQFNASDLSPISRELGKLYSVVLKTTEELAPGQSLDLNVTADKAVPLTEFEFLGTPTKVKIKATTARAGWEQSIYICNTTANPIPLKNLELSFTYTAPMPTTIWGMPWAAWHVVSQANNVVVLAGGTPFTPDLASDPNCMRPLSVQFNASPDMPKPASPFVFKADLGTDGNQTGNLAVQIPAAPANGLSNPTITVKSSSSTDQKQVVWNSTWTLLNLQQGSYTISSSQVSNGSQTFSADPVTVMVSANQTTTQALVYKSVVVSGHGTIAVTMQNAPEAGAANPTVTIQGNGTQFSRTLPWNGKCSLVNLGAGTYTISASDVVVNGKTYKSPTTTVTVEDGKVVNQTITYQLSISEVNHAA